MKNLYNDFLLKNISARELIKALNKSREYVCSNIYQKHDLDRLIEDIAYIANTKEAQEQYEDILIIFHKYLEKRHK